MAIKLTFVIDVSQNGEYYFSSFLFRFENTFFWSNNQMFCKLMIYLFSVVQAQCRVRALYI